MVIFFPRRTPATINRDAGIPCISCVFARVRLIIFALAVASAAGGQSTPPSTLAAPPQTPNSDKPVAAAVRDSKAQKNSHAKKVFTDDDMDATASPLPRLKMDGIDNTDQIIAEVGNYRRTHTPEETEQVMHDWYDEYDSQLRAAIEDNQSRSTLMQENQRNGYELCQQGGDYEKCAKRQMSEAVGARNDQTAFARNNAAIHRLQQAFMKIRNSQFPFNQHYAWFKIRTTNNIDTY
jgi:hypothetical protein